MFFGLLTGPKLLGTFMQKKTDTFVLNRINFHTHAFLN